MGNPEPRPGLRLEDLRKTCRNGLGDGFNSYAHAMGWFEGRLYVGTTRAVLQKLKTMIPLQTEFWPVDASDLTATDFEERVAPAEIWRFDPVSDHWERVFRSPLILGSHGQYIAREMGFRSLTLFQGASDSRPTLYLGNFSRAQGPGAQIVRSEDGVHFEAVSEGGLMGLAFTSIRLLVPFKGKLFTAPTGAKGGNQNASGVCMIFESDDPAGGIWRAVNEPGFGDPGNLTVFIMNTFEDHLYAGTFNNAGFQLWRTDAEGQPPYRWECVIQGGAGRGALNQVAVSLIPFKGALYLGTGIQNGGCDLKNNIGPAGAEILRVHPDGSWDLLVGERRADGRFPASGFTDGFNNVRNGYIWRMGAHDGWLYAGTMNWSSILRYMSPDIATSAKVRRIIELIGLDNLVDEEGGSELWRTFDGENWLPVDRRGFGNVYNYGIRNIVSTPAGLFIGTANPFGPRVAVKAEGQWTYADNPLGGLEVWLGNRAPVQPAALTPPALLSSCNGLRESFSQVHSL
ncbi:MAG: hypothetical protein KME03_06940 [Aphanocapsa lilacina HA4352-LM1]|jgi:hypothetical protein|nr:hypothetical protein [Aphanocapsa lilacina HA4352-LM1]